MTDDTQIRSFVRFLDPANDNGDTDGITALAMPNQLELWQPVSWGVARLYRKDGHYGGFQWHANDQWLVADPHEDRERAGYTLKVINMACAKGDRGRRQLVAELDPLGDGSYIGVHQRRPQFQVIRMRPDPARPYTMLVECIQLGLDPANRP
jgi:hypothetical protein